MPSLPECTIWEYSNWYGDKVNDLKIYFWTRWYFAIWKTCNKYHYLLNWYHWKHPESSMCSSCVRRSRQHHCTVLILKKTNMQWFSGSLCSYRLSFLKGVIDVYSHLWWTKMRRSSAVTQPSLSLIFRFLFLLVMCCDCSNCSVGHWVLIWCSKTKQGRSTGVEAVWHASHF